jgi:hypothetical protein
MRDLAGWPLAIRGIVVLAGVALLVLPGGVHPIPFIVTVVGVAAAVIAPRTVGASVASAGFVIAWLAAAGWAGTLPVGRTVGAAAALYALQVSATMAGCLPLRARVERAVITRWALRCARPLPIAAALVAVDEALPRQTGTPWIEFAGLLSVVALGAGAVYAVRRRGAPPISMEGRARPR